MITENIIGYKKSGLGDQAIHSFNPKTHEMLDGEFKVATKGEIELAIKKAKDAFPAYRALSDVRRAEFLEAIAEEIESLGDQLVSRVMSESGLPEGRVKGERGRTCNQLKLFAKVLREGSWVNAVIDTADEERAPIPKPDVRKMMTAIGPVVVFTASNFPLAFSTAGGDTASALASGCPVIVKAHESHLGTNAWVSYAIQQAAQKTGMPEGVFSSLLGSGYQLGQDLVRHPDIKGVAFTGSHRGGLALFKMAAEREEPIPVFAEMGSTNPVFLTPEYVADHSGALAKGVAGSVNLGAGQFCTNPGILVVIEDITTKPFIENLIEAFSELNAATMLNAGIRDNYLSGRKAAKLQEGVATEFESLPNDNHSAPPAIYSTSASKFISNPKLHKEIFGPTTILIKCESIQEMIEVARSVNGQLTGSIFLEDETADKYHALATTLQDRVGRLIFNGFPTGVEVGYAMQHGGPFPATTDSRYTSVGTDAIYRFVRPVAYQDCPDSLLPVALQNTNPLGILRKVNGTMTKEQI